jgi:hypothetical protein
VLELSLLCVVEAYYGCSAAQVVLAWFSYFLCCRPCHDTLSRRSSLRAMDSNPMMRRGPPPLDRSGALSGARGLELLVNSSPHLTGSEAAGAQTPHGGLTPLKGSSDQEDNPDSYNTDSSYGCGLGAGSGQPELHDEAEETDI